MALLLLNEDELRQTINLSEAVAAIEHAFVAAGEGQVTIPGKFSFRLPEVNGKVNVKGAYIQDTSYYVIRIGSRFLNNLQINLPTRSGLIIVFDAATGFPAAVLVDNGYIANVRGGIVGALATRHLANTPINTVTVIGAGRQAFTQLKALLTIERVDLVKVWSPTPIETDAFARRIVEDHNVNITFASSIESAVEEADVLITATPSREPLIRAEWLKPGIHITAAGSNTPDKQELHTDVLHRADIIVVDNYAQCAEMGEFHHGLAAGVITPADVHGELRSLIAGSISGREHPEQITLIDLTGLEWQDTTLATLALDKALFLGLGQRMESGLKQTHVGPRIDNLL